jgi:hypothetical protein
VEVPKKVKAKKKSAVKLLLCRGEGEELTFAQPEVPPTAYLPFWLSSCLVLGQIC